MRKVRTTNEPDVEREVTDQEYLDLERWGLVVKEESKAKAAVQKEADK